MSSSSDVNMQNFLDAVTVALQHDDDIEYFVNTSPVPRDEMDSLVHVIQSLHDSLVAVEPSAKFANQLHDELMGTRPRGVVTTVRQMPARVHVAAILTVVAGFVLIVYRRLIGSAPTQDITEEPVTI